MKKLLKIMGTIALTFLFIMNVKAEAPIKSLGYTVKEYGIFDIIGNKGTNDYSTTFGNYGYYTKLVIDGKEVIFANDDDFVMADSDKDYLTLDEKTITYNNPEYGKFIISLENTNDKTVVVTYKLTNETGRKVPFKIGTTTDVDFAGNDEAAIIKDNISFIITQDNYSDDAYKAQLGIALNPNSSTTYIGPYDGGDYCYKVFDESEREYYTASDGVDTALAYSWQGEIDIDETKTYTATFTIGEAENINLNFYYLNEQGEYEDPVKILALGGGEVELPEITSSEKGYNFKWYDNVEGTGTGYYSKQIIVSPTKETNYYEVKKSNNLVTPTELNAGGEKIVINNYGDAQILPEDLENKILPMFEEKLKETYDDANILLLVEDITEIIDEDERQLIDEKISADYKMGIYFDASLYLVTTKENNDRSIEQITKLNNPIKIVFQLPENMKNQDSTMKRQYQVLRLHEGKVDTIDADYNEQDNILTFETDEFSTYALTYKDISKTEEPNPDTSDNIKTYISIGFASMTLLLGTTILNKKYN